MIFPESHVDCISVNDFAARVGFSVPTIRRRIKDGSIRICQPGGPGTRLAIPLSELTRLQRTSEETHDAQHEDRLAPSTKPLSGRTPRWKGHIPNQQR